MTLIACKTLMMEGASARDVAETGTTMNTGDLIKVIAQDAQMQPVPMARRLFWSVTGSFVVAALALIATIGVRPDIWAALTTSQFDVKLFSVATLLSGAWAAARQLSRPETDARTTLVIMTLPLLVLAVAVVSELLSTEAATWGARAIGTQAKVCSVAILGLSFAILLMTAMRVGAPRSPKLAGAVVGPFVGATGAFFHAIHCPDDSPIFVALWYTLPVAALAAFGVIIGNHVLRW